MEIYTRFVYSAATLYMLLILIRWLGPWLELDLQAPRVRWIPRAVDPLLHRIRRLLPAMGPMDFGPIAAILLVWVVRLLFTGIP